MRVIELSDREGSAAWCCKLLRGLPAEVVKVEPPDRRVVEPARDLYLNGGKRRVALDYENEEDRRRVAGLAGRSDVLVTDAPARDVERLGLLDLGAPVSVSVTPFGLSGPYRDWEATDTTLMALAGHTYLMGDPDRPPLSMPGSYPSYQAGAFAFVGATACALNGGSARVEVSVLESLVSLHQFTDTMWTAAGRLRRRNGNRFQGLHPVTLLPCADGWFGVNVLDDFWFRFAFMINRPDLAEEHPYERVGNRWREADEVDRIILEALGGLPKRQIFTDGQETWRVPTGYLATLGEVLEEPHLRERGFWAPLGETGLRAPGCPYRLGGEPLPAEPPPAPPGRDTHEVLAVDGEPRSAPAGSRTGARPLAGLRVLDLSHVWSGPLAARLLADLGADVVKVEGHYARGPGRDADPGTPPGRQPWNRQPLFTKLNRNRRSVAVDLKKPAGRELFLDLVRDADVLLENFSARALPSLGLSYDILEDHNPRLIYVAMPGFGLSGPYKDYVALGPSTEPMTGLTALMGYTDDEPRVTAQAVLDPMAGMLAAVAVLHALQRRERTGEGALVELSQYEGGIAFFGEHLLERQLAGAEPHRWGNGHPRMAPHGVYPCRGTDEWIVIAVPGEAAWLAVCDLAGRGWADDPRFASLESRLRYRRELDEAVGSWTSAWDKTELSHALQGRGVPAAPVRSTPEWLADPHLEARGYYSELADADAEPRRSDGLPVLINGVRDYSWWQRAPMLGEHNAQLLRESAGVDEAALQRLYEEGVLAERPPDAGEGRE